MSVRLPRAIGDVVRSPAWPQGFERTPRRPPLGLEYPTEWSRQPLARFVRAAVLDNLTRPALAALAAPEVVGIEHLEPLDGPVIFTANHTSHLDTALVLTSLPTRFRHKTVVAAAADYFFDRRWKAGMWALLLGTIPIERTRVNRRSADLAADLLRDGWNLVIFPEGGRTPDGWGQEFRGGAAYLAKRCGVPVVPVHLQGARPIFPKGGSVPRRGKVVVRIGDPLRPLDEGGRGGRGEDARRFAARIEAAIATLADEAETDWWSARRRAAEGATPPFRGPEASPWRRTWELPPSARWSPTRRKARVRPW